tara:strand:- start:435 stop:800 length:366 start_codon:yes stop_codon:yes gene_type:complete
MGLMTNDPIIAGSIRAVYNASSVNNANWNDLVSSDFVDTVTGLAVASDLNFAFIAVVSKGNDFAYIKYRARSGSGDTVTNEIPVDLFYSDDIVTLNTTVKTIAYKKNAASDTFYIIAGFIK